MFHFLCELVTPFCSIPPPSSTSTFTSSSSSPFDPRRNQVERIASAPRKCSTPTKPYIFDCLATTRPFHSIPIVCLSVRRPYRRSFIVLFRYSINIPTNNILYSNTPRRPPIMFLLHFCIRSFLIKCLSFILRSPGL